MKKTIVLWGMLFCIFTQYVKAQRPDINFGEFSNPVPSVSSLSSYNSIPQSNATGLPEIVMPLLDLPSRNREIPLGISLSYNTLNAEKDKSAADIGIGWSLFGGGVISRTIVDNLDEEYYDVTLNHFKKNQFNDIYYYNIPGASGKFKFVRDIDANTFQLVNLSANKVKIEYTRTSNTTTLILNSFTITDAKGNKFFFNDYSLANLNGDLYGGSTEYRSAFFLTKIVDANNIELATFTYEKKSKNKVYLPTEKIYQYCKLKSINSPGFGKIEFEYFFEEPWRMNDPYQVQKVVLKDQNNHIISGYAFEYTEDRIEDGQLAGGDMQYIYKRMLNKVKKLDKNNTVSETTSFEYKSVNYTPANLGAGYSITVMCADYGILSSLPKMTRPILQRIINPSGGVVEYNFEYGTVFKSTADPAYLSTILNGTDFIDDEIQFVKPYDNLFIDTTQNIDFPLTVTGAGIRKIFIYFSESDITPPLPEEEIGSTGHLGFQILRNGIEVQGYFCIGKTRYKIYDLSPGNYTVKVFGINGKQGLGSLFLYEISHIPQPFPNIKSGADIRINNIKYYNSITDGAPLKTMKYEYNDFINPVPTSTGYYFYNEMDADQNRHVLYKNVKITDDNGGYTQYFYKNPDDYPEVPYSGGKPDEQFWPYYSITNGGLLEKTEVYNSSHKLLSSEENQYSFEDIPGSIDYPLFTTLPQELTRPFWLKKLTKTATAYFENGRSVQETSETNFGVFNFQPVLTKKIVDGRTEEQINTYPETGYANLSAAHILNTPVIVENKIDGKLVSRVETQYTNPASLYPTAIAVSNIGNTAQKTATIDLYDEKGNVIQYTDTNGNVVTTIYGYDKTLPIAKIEGAAYTQVSSLVQAIISASDADAADPSKEPQLLAALDSFRNNTQLNNFLITTYTYDPLIGSTTVTPPNGIRAVYKYDSQNRLEKIVDMNGLVLKEYQYNYKN
ncbi:hypothetical protein [Chryseobacterium sp.]|uniref:hypothetical protein n=1 Tax=Chryseobacterium sp. TaxID=1871047 RepID=UPI0026167734|nr:hypothetical protein [Chryseobacterium sp.]